MSLFGRNNYLAIQDEMPDGKLARFFFRMGTFFPKLFALNLLLLLFSLGVVTLPAAVTAADRVLLKIVRREDFSVWYDFIEEFRQSFWKSLGLGAFFGLFYFMSIFALEVFPGAFQGAAKWLALGFAALILLLSWLVSSYALALLAYMEQPAGQILKNAVLLIFIAPRQSFQLICTGLAVVLEVCIFPFSIPLILLGSGAWVQYLICRILHQAMKEYILPPEDQETDLEDTEQ